MSMRKITENDSICKKINLLLLNRKEIFETKGDFLKNQRFKMILTKYVLVGTF
jgi:hypothetical protein